MLSIQVGRYVPRALLFLCCCMSFVCFVNVVCFLITHTPICSGTMICVSVFDKVTDNLHQKFELAGLKPKVMVATNVNQKWLEGAFSSM
ncbi:unnamed protein product [Brassica rapa subsp. trilocularis]